MVAKQKNLHQNSSPSRQRLVVVNYLKERTTKSAGIVLKHVGICFPGTESSFDNKLVQKELKTVPPPPPPLLVNSAPCSISVPVSQQYGGDETKNDRIKMQTFDLRGKGGGGGGDAAAGGGGGGAGGSGGNGGVTGGQQG